MSRAACLSSAPSPAVDPTRHRPSRSDARVGTATICTFAAIRHGRSRAIARRRVAGRRPVVISSPERRASRIVLLQRLPRGPLRRVPRRCAHTRCRSRSSASASSRPGRVGPPPYTHSSDDRCGLRNSDGTQGGRSGPGSHPSRIGTRCTDGNSLGRSPGIADVTTGATSKQLHDPLFVSDRSSTVQSADLPLAITHSRSGCRSPGAPCRRRRGRCRTRSRARSAGRGAPGHTRAWSTRRSRQQHAGAGRVGRAWAIQ